MSDEAKASTGGTGMVVAGLIAVFVGLWMVGQTMATEGDAIKLKLNRLSSDIETLTFEVKAIKAHLKKQPAPPAAPAPAPEPVKAVPAEPPAEAEEAPAEDAPAAE